MKKPEHTRPFNLEHARAGAPFSCANGEEVEILKWDRKHTQCIVGLARQDVAIRTWRADGTYNDPNSTAYPLVMLPLGFVEGKPVFVGDVLIDPNGTFGDDEAFTAGPTMRQGHLGHCTWPKPAPVYPETLMMPDELAIAYNSEQKDNKPAGFARSLRAVANAAIARAIEDGQVVTAEEANQRVVDSLIKAGGRNLVPEEMLDMVAKAVAEQACGLTFVLDEARRRNIIANVKASQA